MEAEGIPSPLLFLWDGTPVPRTLKLKNTAVIGSDHYSHWIQEGT